MSWPIVARPNFLRENWSAANSPARTESGRPTARMRKTATAASACSGPKPGARPATIHGAAAISAVVNAAPPRPRRSVSRPSRSAATPPPPERSAAKTGTKTFSSQAPASPAALASVCRAR